VYFGRLQRGIFTAPFLSGRAHRGWLAFHRLDWGERPLAAQYGLLYHNRFHLLQEGYDPAFELYGQVMYCAPG